MSLVRPTLEYSSTARNPHTQNDTTQLDKVQRNAARFILGDYERKSSVTDMQYTLNLDTLERGRQHHMVKSFHKVLYGHDGINIPASIIPSQRDNLTFVQPASRINCHLHSFNPRAIRFWNLLPFHLRNMKDMDAFGQSLTAAVVEKMSSQSHTVDVFIRLLSQVFIRDAPGISEKDENRSRPKSTKVTKVTNWNVFKETTSWVEYGSPLDIIYLASRKQLTEYHIKE